MFDIGQLTGQALPEKFKAKTRAQRQPLPEKFKAKTPAERQKAYLARKKANVRPLQSPWDYLSPEQAAELAKQAYRVATWHAWQEMQEPGSEPLNHFQLRQFFAEQLADFFADAVAAAAADKGQAYLVLGPDEAARRAQVWRGFLADVPDHWRHQYTLFPAVAQKVTPASTTNAPGVVTNIDEGNVDGTNCSS